MFEVRNNLTGQTLTGVYTDRAQAQADADKCNRHHAQSRLAQESTDYEFACGVWVVSECYWPN